MGYSSTGRNQSTIARSPFRFERKVLSHKRGTIAVAPRRVNNHNAVLYRSTFILVGFQALQRQQRRLLNPTRYNMIIIPVFVRTFPSLSLSFPHLFLPSTLISLLIIVWIHSYVFFLSRQVASHFPSSLETRKPAGRAEVSQVTTSRCMSYSTERFPFATSAML